MKKLFCLLLAGLLFLFCTACADWDELADDPLQELSQYYQVENQPQNTVAITAFSLPYYDTETLDGVTCSDGLQQVVDKLLYESLYELDPTFELQPVLAEKSQYDGQTLTYTITLRGGVCFSDGSALTAQDVVDTLLRAADSTRYGSRFTHVDEISASGRSVIITLSEPNGGFLRLLDIPIVKSGTETQKVPLGTGPYAFAKDDDGNYLALNRHWWQNKRLPLSRIELVACKSADAANYAFTAQNVQLLCADLGGIDSVSADVSGACTDAASTVLHYLGFNLRNELLADPAVRQAISCAIDRENLVSTYLLGHGTPAQFPLPPVCTSYPVDLEKAYTREAADNAMQKAGCKTGEKKPSLTLLVNEENRFKVSAASEIARILNQYDLSVIVQVLPWEDYLAALRNGQYDLYYGQTRLHADWDLTALIGTYGTLNYGGFSNPATDELLQSYLAAQGQRRDAVQKSLCETFQQQQPIVPICFKAVSVLVTNHAVDEITPTATDPFYQMENWTVHLAPTP